MMLKIITYRDLRSGGAGRGQVTTWTAGSRLLQSLKVHCKARSRRFRSPIVAMALATLATSQPYRLGDFSHVTCKTGENY